MTIELQDVAIELQDNMVGLHDIKLNDACGQLIRLHDNSAYRFHQNASSIGVSGPGHWNFHGWTDISLEDVNQCLSSLLQSLCKIFLTLIAKNLHNGIQIQGSHFRSWRGACGMGPSKHYCRIPNAILDHHEYHNVA